MMAKGLSVAETSVRFEANTNTEIENYFCSLFKISDKRGT